MLEEVKKILIDIKGAWEEIGSVSDTVSSVAAIAPSDMPPPAGDSLASRDSFIVKV
jgi:hypothetical protein